MNIKLLTFHKANNYGALLQCYALSAILRDWGHNIEIINITHELNSKRLLDHIKSTLDLQQMGKFRRNHLPIQTPKYNNFDELKENPPIAECYIVGSDQVWNPQITRELFGVYFFNFLPKEVKKIAYAASFGIREWNYPELQTKISDLLSRFTAIGIRENDGIELCQSIFGITATKTLDPTLLMDNYDNILSKEKCILKNTLVTYFFEKGDDHFLKLRSFSKRIGLKPISLNDQRYHPGIRSIPFASVKQWLSYIKNSDLVLTNSFHCMVFAIIFKRPFIVIPSDISRMSRIMNLLEDLDLKERYFESFEDLFSSSKWLNSIDYAKVFQILEIHKLKSIKFLHDSISM